MAVAIQYNSQVDNDLYKYCLGVYFNDVGGCRGGGSTIQQYNTADRQRIIPQSILRPDMSEHSICVMGTPLCLRSFNPANITCDTCDTSVATCDFEKSAATAPIGNILVPLEGYWHSSPWSPQVGGRGGRG